MPTLLPSFAAITLAALVVLVSNALRNQNQKLFLQFAIFGVGFAVSVVVLLGYLSSDKGSALKNAFSEFGKVPNEVRFCVTIVLIAAVYFGGGMYIAAPDSLDNEEKPAKASTSASTASAADIFKTPASIDNEVGFEVPAHLPEKDFDFFAAFLPK